MLNNATSSPTPWHERVVDMLSRSLREQCPEQLLVRTALEPDIAIVRAAAVDEVVAAADVAAPEAGPHGRSEAAAHYARQGVPTFWLVERGRAGAPIVHEHRLIAGGYHHMRTLTGRFTSDRPFPIDIPLRDPEQ